MPRAGGRMIIKGGAGVSRSRRGWLTRGFRGAGVMAYLVTDRFGRREFRWLEHGRRRSRRTPRGEAPPFPAGAANRVSRYFAEAN